MSNDSYNPKCVVPTTVMSTERYIPKHCPDNGHVHGPLQSQMCSSDNDHVYRAVHSKTSSPYNGHVHGSLQSKMCSPDNGHVHGEVHPKAFSPDDHIPLPHVQYSVPNLAQNIGTSDTITQRNS